MRKSLIPVVSLILILLLSTLINIRLPIETVKAQQQTPQSISDNFSTDSGLWTYLGSAYRDPTNQDLVLTNSGYDQAGVAFFNYAVSGSFTANFSYLAGGDYSGDGFTMFFYKQPYSTFSNGGDLGFNTQDAIIPGYGIEFDGWQNIPGDFQGIAGGVLNPSTGDPSGAYIGLIQNSVGDHLAYTANDPRVDDNQWHQVSVQVQGSSVSVYVDQGLVLQWTGTLNTTYSGFGFSGATGLFTDWHLISNFSITTQNLPTPSLTTSCVSSVSQSSLNVNINGYLTYNGTGISGAPILLSYSVTGGQSWEDLTLVNTGSDGSYSTLWFPQVTGDYLLKAVYQGDDNYLGTGNIVNFVMAPGTEQSIFSVESNFTISALAFNSTSKELDFTVSGPEGTTGYCDVYIPTSLMTQVSDLSILLNGNPISYNAKSLGNAWLISFSCQTGTSEVTLGMNAADTIVVKGNQLMQWIPYGVIIALMGIIAVLLTYRKTRKNANP